MTKRLKVQLRTADFDLPRSLTDAFIRDLNLILDEDTSFKSQYLRETFLTKFVELDEMSANERRSRAIEKWLATELTNETTNDRLIKFGQSTGVTVIPGISAKKFLDKVAGIVAQVLHVPPSLDIANGGFSGGASTSRTRAHGHPAMKFLGKADVTRPFLPLFHDLIRGTLWGEYFNSEVEIRIVGGNALFTVPKNSNIDRVACKEPDLNMFFQKSLGNQIRFHLKKVGINLNDQSINQELARIGSITGSLMTLDLSSASDSVSYELVRRLLPPDWFYYLDLSRSKQTTIDSVVHENQMFSSMGNGFTFELESLLFYSIARATAYFSNVRGQLSVYGDDIIAPTEIGNNLISALTFCGFRVNESKSFLDGSFRESCGKHWDGGLDVSPIYLRRPFKTISDLILTLNQLTGWASREIGVVDPRYEDLILRYALKVPEDLWGGCDVTSRSSLVTGDLPRKELIWPQELIPYFHMGGYLFWFFQSLTRGSKDCISTAGSRPPRFARIRKNRTVDRTGLPVFLTKY